RWWREEPHRISEDDQIEYLIALERHCRQPRRIEMDRLWKRIEKAPERPRKRKCRRDVERKMQQHHVRLLAQRLDDILEQGGSLACLRKMNRQNFLYHPHFTRRVGEGYLLASPSSRRIAA